VDIAKTAFMENRKNGASGEAFYFKYARVRGFRAKRRVSAPDRLF
jgi:hypothetical protein